MSLTQNDEYEHWAHVERREILDGEKKKTGEKNVCLNNLPVHVLDLINLFIQNRRNSFRWNKIHI